MWACGTCFAYPLKLKPYKNFILLEPGNISVFWVKHYQGRTEGDRLWVKTSPLKMQRALFGVHFLNFRSFSFAIFAHDLFPLCFHLIPLPPTTEILGYSPEDYFNTHFCNWELYLYIIIIIITSAWIMSRDLQPVVSH